ncbi:hypothetical protein [Celeribacter sp.]|uniref:hypothetical protein n=1 Tax=Celeribacter sp. TaxID=1890673 RepID=UPI003A919515
MTHRLLALTTVSALLAGVCFAAPPSLFSLCHPAEQAREIIEIPVPADELARCIATLDQVFLSPVDGAAVETVSLGSEHAPVVKCVIEGVAT